MLQVQDDDQKKRKQIAKDGETVVVSMTMMDSLSRAMVTGLLGDGRFLPMNDAERRQRAERQAARDKALSQRWKNPPAVSATVSAPAADKAATQPTNDVEEARRRYDARISNRWRKGNQA